MPTHKVFLSGLDDSGRTQTIKIASDLPLISAIKKISKTQREVELDYGRVHFGSHMVYLYAVTGVVHMPDDWAGLSSDLSGLVHLIDGRKGALVTRSLALLEDLRRVWSGPTVIGVGYADSADFDEGACAAVELAMGDSVPVMPFSALSRTSSVSLIQAWLSLATS